MVKFFCLILILISSSCGTREATRQSEARARLKMGLSLIENRSYPQALGELLKAEELAPRDPEIQHALGIAYVYRGRPEMAETHFQKAIRLDSKMTQSRVRLAELFLNQGNHAKAESLLKEAQEDLTYPFPGEVLALQGKSLYQQNKPKEALSLFKKSISYDRGGCLSHFYTGKILFEEVQFGEAAQALDRSIGFCPANDYEEAHYLAGLSHFRNGDRDKARARMRDLLRTFPDGRFREPARELLNQLER